jgi:hypothetical protein
MLPIQHGVRGESASFKPVLYPLSPDEKPNPCHNETVLPPAEFRKMTITSSEIFCEGDSYEAKNEMAGEFPRPFRNS